MSDLLLIALSLALANRFALMSPWGGLTALSGRERNVFPALAAASVAVTLVTAAVYLGFRSLLPMAGFAGPLLLVAASGLLAQLLARHAGAHLTARPVVVLLTANGSVLALAIEQATTGLEVFDTAGRAVGLAAGFAVVLVALPALCDRIDSGDVPAPFRGAPIELVTVGLAALAFLGLSGLLPG